MSAETALFELIPQKAGSRKIIMNKKFFIALLFTLIFISFDVEAQCAMCRAVLESEEGQSTAEGVNNGIVYLMAIPYLVVAGIGYAIYRKFKN